MCNECYSTPCNPRCPNAPDPPTAHICPGCKDPIFVGQRCFFVDGVAYCKDCVSEGEAEREEMGRDE